MFEIKSFAKHIKHGIARRLLFHFLWFTILITVFTTFYQLYIDYTDDVELINNRLHSIETSHLHSIIASLWGFDMKLLNVQLDGIVELPGIQYLKIIKDDRIIASAGKAQKDKVIVNQFALNYKSFGEKHFLGTLYVMVSREELYSKLTQKFFIILGVKSLNFFLLSAFLFVVFYFLVGRHLQSIAAYAQKYDINLLNPLLTLDRNKYHNEDELDHLVHSINKMNKTIKYQTKDLKEERNFVNTILESASALVVVLDSEGRIVLFNRACEEITYYSFDEVKGKYLWDILLDPKDIESVKEVLQDLKEGSLSNEYRNYWLCKDKSKHLITWSNSVVLGDDSSIDHIIAIGKDITEQSMMKNALIESEEKYRSLFDNALDMIHIIDSKGIIIDVNKCELETLGYKRDDFVGKPLAHFIHPDAREETQKALFRVIHGESIDKYETSFITSGNKKIDVEVSAAPHFKSGKIDSVRGILRDITKRKKAEEALVESEERFQLAVQGTNNGIWDWNMITDKQWWSERYRELTGYSEEELPTRYESWLSLLHPEDKERVLENLQNHLDHKSPYYTEFRMNTKRNGYRWFLVCGTSVQDGTGQNIRMAGSIQDITERKKAEEDLLLANTAIEMSVDPVIYTDFDENIIFCNKSFINLWGYENKSEVIGRKALEFWNYFVDPEIMVKSLLDNEEWVGEVPCSRKDGSVFRSRMAAKILVDQEGRSICLMASLSDLTEQIRVQEAVLAASELSERVIAESPIGIVMYDSNGQCISVNSSLAEMIGGTKDQVLSQNYHQLDSWKKSGLYDIVQESIGDQEKKRHEFEVVSTFGKNIYFDSLIVPFIQQNEQNLMIMMDDITKRKKVEEEIQRLASIVKYSSDFIGVSDIEGRALFLNEAGRNMVGIRDDDHFFSTTVPDYFPDRDRERVEKEIIPTLMADGRWVGEINFQHFQSGQTIPVWFDIFRIDDPKTGQPINFATVTQDITERKEAENIVRFHVHQLKQANQELEEFNYVASHDIKEPLRTLSNYSTLLERHLGESISPKARQDLDFIIDAAKRMGRLVDDMLSLSRISRNALELEDVDLNKVMEYITQDLQTRITETKGKVSWKDLPIVQGDRSQLSRLLQNLISNGLKFYQENDPVIVVSAKGQNTGWEISVADNGIGMEEQYLEQIFAPFKRLHGMSKYQGTGIGLSICRKIIERHEGKIWAESTSGKGSTFKFTLNTHHNDLHV